MDTHKLYSWFQRRNVISTDTHREDELEESLLHQPLLRAAEDHQVASAEDARLLPEDQEDAQAPQAHLPLGDQRATVQRQMPPSLAMFAGKQSFIRDGLYTYLDSSGTAKKARRNKPSKKYMLPILDGLRRLDTMLDAPFNLNDEKPIQDCFHGIIVACEHYLENRNPWTREGKARKQMIQDFYEQVKYESLGFAGIVDNMRRGIMGVNAPTTWIDVISQVRTETIEDGRNGVTVTEGGAGTSKLYIVEQNGVRRYFKENEAIPAATYDELHDQEIERLHQEEAAYLALGGHDVYERAEFSNRIFKKEKYLKIVKKYLTIHFEGNKDAVFHYLWSHPDKDDLIDNMCNTLNKYYEFREEFNPLIQERIRLSSELNQLKANYAAETNPVAKAALKTTLDEKNAEFKDCYLEYVGRTVLEIKKGMLSHAIAVTDAKIDAESELSKRNVATSRMAKLLGLEGMVVGSRMAEVLINGKRMRGIIMDEAPGKSSDEVEAEEDQLGKSVRYSPEVFHQLMNLQVFDIICGQVDRHRGNYLCTRGPLNNNPASDVTELRSLMAIDNDMSFGTLTYQDILERGAHGLNKIRNIEIDGLFCAPYVDYDLYNNIRNLTEERINYEMCDILTKEERKALYDRIQGVRKAFEKLMEAEAQASRQPGFFSRVIGKPGNPLNWATVASDFRTLFDNWCQENDAKADREYQKRTDSLAAKTDLSPAEIDMAQMEISQQHDEDLAIPDSNLESRTYLYAPHLLGT